MAAAAAARPRCIGEDGNPCLCGLTQDQLASNSVTVFGVCGPGLGSCGHPFGHHPSVAVAAAAAADAGDKRSLPSPEDARVRKRLKAESGLMCTAAAELFNLLTTDATYANLTAAQCSDPRVLQHLPFPVPSTIRAPSKRFHPDDQARFAYMGRSAFNQILTQLRSSQGDQITVFGSEGYGKSFILAALACFLIRETARFRKLPNTAAAPRAHFRPSRLNHGRDPRVVYLADCEDLINNLSLTMRTALTLAFADSPAIMQEIAELETQKHFYDFVGSKADKVEFIWILDQHNALEAMGDPEDAGAAAAKGGVCRWLNSLCAMHMSILGASPTALATPTSSSSEQSTFRFDLFGGLETIDLGGGVTEWSAWRQHFGADLPEMDVDEHARMEFLTGRVPLYLHSLLEATIECRPRTKQRVALDAQAAAVEASKAAGSDDPTAKQAGDHAKAAVEASAVVYTPLFHEVWPAVVADQLRTQMKNITRFSNTLVGTSRWNAYAEFIDAALVGASAIHLDQSSLYDHRYFYFSKVGSAHCVCGHLAECAALDLKSKQHFIATAKE